MEKSIILKALSHCIQNKFKLVIYVLFPFLQCCSQFFCCDTHQGLEIRMFPDSLNDNDNHILKSFRLIHFEGLNHVLKRIILFSMLICDFLLQQQQQQKRWLSGDNTTCFSDIKKCLQNTLVLNQLKMNWKHKDCISTELHRSLNARNQRVFWAEWF